MTSWPVGELTGWQVEKKIMKIKRFENIDVWKESRKLVNMIYDLTSKGLFRRDFGLRDQIQRAAVSCMSNVAEGFDSDTKQQFIQMLSYTKRSSSEVQSELYVALDRRYVTKEEFNNSYNHAQLVRKLANGFIRYLRTRPLTRKPAN
ncbi:MAG: four helix bundle protein [Candidatus Ratteibacteria bacterium]|nr:four helix bundle protein [Candidatus Ratteibacteria bacterium]